MRSGLRQKWDYSRHRGRSSTAFCTVHRPHVDYSSPLGGQVPRPATSDRSPSRNKGVIPVSGSLVRHIFGEIQYELGRWTNLQLLLLENLVQKLPSAMLICIQKNARRNGKVILELLKAGVSKQCHFLIPTRTFRSGQSIRRLWQGKLSRSGRVLITPQDDSERLKERLSTTTFLHGGKQMKWLKRP